ncbi:MAG: hypothetical protein Q8K63_04905, partial [Acidimicrobiales bacterium]|nr:hypothetical protein [Acidimicrobiales bacterium]
KPLATTTAGGRPMTALDSVSIDELCTTLGLRAPIGIRIASVDAVPGVARVTALNDEQLAALNVLAQPEAIAIVTHVPPPEPFTRRVPVTFVIATRGAYVAEHVIEGATHHLYARDAVNAPTLLLERTGFGTPAASSGAPLDVTVGGYRRMVELLRAGDRRRAEAALLADGAVPHTADALLAAVAVGRIEVTGLANDGRRYVGCDLSVAGDATSGRWHVPHDTNASPNLRTLIEAADHLDLVDDLALVFGDVWPSPASLT